MQPRVDYPVPVEGGLRQSEPGAGVLGPKRRQLYLGWRHVLLGNRHAPEYTLVEGETGIPEGSTAALAPGTDLAALPGILVVTRGGLLRQSGTVDVCSFSCVSPV